MQNTKLVTTGQKPTKSHGTIKPLKFATTHTGCMVCLSHVPEKNGYIRIVIDRKSHYLHRVIYEMHNGPIPKGLYVCHKCDNPACSNPEHLFLGTPRDNAADMVKKDRQSKGEERHNAKLTTNDVATIKKQIGTKRQRDIAKEFGVHESLIYQIKTNLRWSHL